MQSLLNFSPRWNLIVTLNFCDIFRLSNSCFGLSLKDLLFHWKYQVPCCDLLFICQALLFWCLVKNQVLAQKSTLEPSTTALNLLFIQKHKRKNIQALFVYLSLQVGELHCKVLVFYNGGIEWRFSNCKQVLGWFCCFLHWFTAVFGELNWIKTFDGLLY